MSLIGLIDSDNKNPKKPFPNLALMKIAAWHKKQGDTVEWYNLINATNYYLETMNNMYDKVYISKVFSFSQDYENFIFANEIVKGGSGYAIKKQDGKETYIKELDKNLPYEIEHIMPDYSIYNITDTAYGFMSRGCPPRLRFLHCKRERGTKKHKSCRFKRILEWAKKYIFM